MKKLIIILILMFSILFIYRFYIDYTAFKEAQYVSSRQSKKAALLRSEIFYKLKSIIDLHDVPNGVSILNAKKLMDMGIYNKDIIETFENPRIINEDIEVYTIKYGPVLCLFYNHSGMGCESAAEKVQKTVKKSKNYTEEDVISLDDDIIWCKIIKRDGGSKPL